MLLGRVKFGMLVAVLVWILVGTSVWKSETQKKSLG